MITKKIVLSNTLSSKCFAYSVFDKYCGQNKQFYIRVIFIEEVQKLKNGFLIATLSFRFGFEYVDESFTLFDSKNTATQFYNPWTCWQVFVILGCYLIVSCRNFSEQPSAFFGIAWKKFSKCSRGLRSLEILW